jgi:hypothetical protein
MIPCEQRLKKHDSGGHDTIALLARDVCLICIFVVLWNTSFGTPPKFKICGYEFLGDEQCRYVIL